MGKDNKDDKDLDNEVYIPPSKNNMIKAAVQNAEKLITFLKKERIVQGIITKEYEFEVEDITKKLDSLMKERDSNILSIEKKYLMEIIAEINLKPNLTEIRHQLIPLLKRKGFIIEDKGSQLKISHHKLKYKIENIIASVAIKTNEILDLNQIANLFLTNVEYNRERFP